MLMFVALREFINTILLFHAKTKVIFELAVSLNTPPTPLKRGAVTVEICLMLQLPSCVGLGVCCVDFHPCKKRWPSV